MAVFSASGELTEVVGTQLDVTECKRAEEERERLRQVPADLAHINRVTTMGELTASLAHDLPKVIADRVQLQQVFMNLMLNGIEAMKEMGSGSELVIPLT